MRKAAFCTIILVVAMFLARRPARGGGPSLYLQGPGTSSTNGYLPTASIRPDRWWGICCQRREVTTPFLWSGGIKHDLGTLRTPYDYSSYAKGINAAGQVVGTSYTSSSGCPRLSVDSGGGMQDLGTPPGPDDKYYAYGINAAGQVAGYPIPSSGSQRSLSLQRRRHDGTWAISP